MSCRRVLVRSLPLVGVVFMLGCPEPAPQVRRLEMSEEEAGSRQPRFSERDRDSEEENDTIGSNQDAHLSDLRETEAKGKGEAAGESSR
jgi:hypothetical protein